MLGWFADVYVHGMGSIINLLFPSPKLVNDYEKFGFELLVCDQWNAKEQCQIVICYMKSITKPLY